MSIPTTNNPGSLYFYDDEFRDSIATVDGKGKRLWIYPKKPSGSYHRLRVIVTVGLLSLFFSGPFITIKGQPFLLLNIFERRFVLFGQAFWPQDFVLLALVLIAFFVFIILFTVVFGRIWCGWMCPQTLFMEMVFRKIEYWIEGDAGEQRRLNNDPWNFNKLWRKSLKQSIFLLISIVIAHTAMAYLIGARGVFDIVQHSPSENLAGFTGIIVFTGIFYFVFAYFREQVCIAICPYGRLQGVLLVKDSIVVAYDWLRGEPRGKIKKEASILIKKGDCIDCKLCVHVCPTGIDIRNGTQLECVNCTACIDVCDDVMLKIGKPKGLIRLASFSSIQNGIQKILTPRVMGYSVVLVALLVFLSFMIATRAEVETTILKVSGTLYQQRDNGIISNLYNVEYVNKTFTEKKIELRIESPTMAGLVKPDGKPVVVVAPGGLLKVIYFIDIPAAKITSSSTTVYVGVYSDGKKIERVKVKFIGPVNNKR
jgi:cytochrome c oxidase accessory protein FixG